MEEKTVSEYQGFERVMPFSREAEQSVLGAMLLDMQRIPDAMAICRADDFYIERNKELFNTILELYNLGKPIDMVTIKEQLTLRGSYDSVGGLEFVMETMNMVPTTRNIKHYAEIVAQKALLRNIIKISEKAAEDSYRGDEEADIVIGEMEQKLIDLSQERTSKGPVHLRTYLGQSVENLAKLSENNDDVTGIATGFIDIDKRTAGLHGSELVLIAARPGMGKTSFALNIAQNAAISTGTTVAVFNLEMPGIQIANRMLSSEAMVSSDALKKGNIKDSEWEKIGEAVEVLSNANIYIDDTSSITAPEIVARCRKLKMEHNLGLVVIDYIQLISGSNSKSEGNRQQEISEISRSLKIMANELKIPVIALSQLSRAVEKRESKEPMLSDLRESGAIEQDADMVMFLYREGAYNEAAEEPNRTKCIFAKHRNGETGYDYLTWLGEFTKFSNWSGSRE
ncbi:MAG: replicative DNA helicase [Clostridia bacterium]|nr:replicative DNA helicase [Clostridia bacterium]